MSDLEELYQQTVLDHNRRPRNFRRLPDATSSVEGDNPLCGDHFYLDIKLENDVIKDIGFEGSGCAISKASASMMTDDVKGKTKEEAERLFDLFHDVVAGDLDPMVAMEKLGKVGILSGVREFPARVKCATLAWHTLRAALNGAGITVSTE